jgi:hypothetical protein
MRKGTSRFRAELQRLFFLKLKHRGLVKTAPNALRGSFVVPVNPIPGHKEERTAQTWCRRPRGQRLSSSKFFRPGLPTHVHVGKTPRIPIEQIKRTQWPVFLCCRPVLLEKRKYQKSLALSRTYVRVFSHIDLQCVFKERLIVQWIKVAGGIFDGEKIKRAGRFLNKELARERLVTAPFTPTAVQGAGTASRYLALNWQQAKTKTRSSSIERRFARPDQAPEFTNATSKTIRRTCSRGAAVCLLSAGDQEPGGRGVACFPLRSWRNW